MRTHQAYIEYMHRTSLSRDPVAGRAAFGAGVGGAGFDFDRDLDDTGGAAVMIRAEAGLTLFRRFDLVVGGAAFLWGYPGETVGYGGFLTLGASVRF